MGKTLVLAEKPSVARDLAKVLSCTQNSDGCIIGVKYIVTWALGHLVTLADPEAYNSKYKTWNLEDLPMLPKKMDLVVIKETSKQFGIVRSLLHRNDIDELVIATDAGREGELVARWILEKAGFTKPVKRLWISSQTDKAIKEGFAKLRPAKEYDNLFLSAQSRSEADWLVGLNVTRALTCKHNAQLSAGRVQTPTLALIVDRENEIRRFTPRDYWTISAGFFGFTIKWQDKSSGQTRIFDRKQADNIVSAIAGQVGEVTEIIKESKKDLPPLAYDLTELQRDANRIYGFSAKQTLNIMQKLYETYKLVTYPRTDSRYITEDIVPTLVERLKSISIGSYKLSAQELLKTRLNVTKRFVDSSKVSDHHAIIPTEQYVDLNPLSIEERRIYDLIVKRFIAVLSQPFEYEQTTVKVDVKGERFYAKGRIIKASGWKKVYEGFGNQDGRNAGSNGGDKGNGNGDDEDDDDYDDDFAGNAAGNSDQPLPNIVKGQKDKVAGTKAVNGKTKPPPRYTEATLLTAMEHPGKFIDNKVLRETIEGTSGLGTPATRADIIEKLFSTFYVEKKGKQIYPTSKGIQLIGLVPQDLKSAELTAKWEQQLSLISKGKTSAKMFVADMGAYASKLVSAVIANSEIYKHDNLTREKCECGKYMLEVNGKRGKMLVCPDKECGKRRSVSQTSNARCPECHKNMEIRGEGDNKSFFCSCGFREKLESYAKRRGEKVNKRDVSDFLRNQSKDEPINSTFADALSKWRT